MLTFPDLGLAGRGRSQLTLRLSDVRGTTYSIRNPAARQYLLRIFTGSCGKHGFHFGTNASHKPLPWSRHNDENPVIPTGAGATATAEWTNLLFARASAARTTNLSSRAKGI
jgi:hypothetical protein